MKKTFVFVVLVMFSLILIFSSDAFAQRGQRKGMGRMCGMIAKELDLTKDQQAQIEKLRYSHQKAMIDYQAEIKKLSVDMKNQWKAEKVEKKNIESAMDKISQVKSQMQKVRLAHWFDIYNLLDDQQKETFKQMRHRFSEGVRQRFQQRKDNFRERMGRPLPPPPPKD
ncbi:MAG: periplasmic heavy metal sensor [Ignavibacteria bacterium]|nr:periplasmic heavy metal sensor [Ignavibacteria bacterium]